ncbi:hypothetical protein GCM10022200_05620 [Microbacterium awajiense]|uniref:DUF4131 domain-containing protein n=1 Tax=Microbacterium awajiense TaxID=415214 RepID=A0ABP7A6Z2_9MICO
MRRAALRGVPVAAAAWVSAGYAIHHAAHATPIALALGVLAASLAAVSVFVGRREWAVVASAACAVAAAAALSVVLASPARSAVQQLAADGARVLTIDAVATGKVQAAPDGAVRFEAIVIDARDGAQRVTGAAPVRIRGVATERIDVGSIVRVRATGAETFPDDRAALSVRAIEPIEVLAGPGGLLATASDLRRGLVDASTGLPGAGAGLVPGLAVGDTSAVSAELDGAMKVSSQARLE